MLLAEKFHMPRLVLVVFLLAFMAVKAVMIAGNFMHLRFEKANLGVMVAAGIVVTSLILFLFITPETTSILAKTPQMTRARPVGCSPLSSCSRSRAAPAALAQCSMCKAVVAQSPEGQRMAGELNKAILVMLAAPYLVFGSCAAVLFRSRLGRARAPPRLASSSSPAERAQPA